MSELTSKITRIWQTLKKMKLDKKTLKAILKNDSKVKKMGCKLAKPKSLKDYFGLESNQHLE